MTEPMGAAHPQGIGCTRVVRRHQTADSPQGRLAGTIHWRQVIHSFTNVSHVTGKCGETFQVPSSEHEAGDESSSMEDPHPKHSEHLVHGNWES
eukprot:4407124-Amphidinium_carterae.1